jgi:hypothetical protein
MPDVDAQLERGGRDQHLEPALLEALLGIQARLLREAAVVRGHALRAEPFRELVRHALGEAARVHRNERCAVRLDQRHQPVIDLLPHLVRHDRFERRAGHLDGKVQMALVALVHDGGFLLGEKPGHLVDRLLGGRQADALQPPAADMVQALERQREVRAAPRLEHGMDLVHDHHARALQHGARALRGEQQVQRLGRGDEDVRRRFQHRRALVLRRVAGAHGRGDFDFRAKRVNFAARLGQILVDVGRQRLERRNVDDAHFVGQAGLQAFSEKAVDRGEKGGKGLPGARGRRNQRMLAAPDSAPAFELGGGGLAETAFPPALQDGMEILG